MWNSADIDLLHCSLFEDVESRTMGDNSVNTVCAAGLCQR